jgi:hypothetical protein
MRGALGVARITRQPPWSHLPALGQELGVAEIGELAVGITLAGPEGVNVKTSLSAQVRASRDHPFAVADAPVGGG